MGRLHRLLTRRLPVLLRVLAAICFLWLAGTALRAPGGLVETPHWPGVLTPQASATLIMALGLVGFVSTLFGLEARFVSTLFGLEARLGALLLLFPAGASISTGGLNLANGLLLACAITLLHTGGGDWALWRPSDRLFLQRLGRPRK